MTGGVQVLEEQEDQGKLVKQVNAQDYAPEDRVWTNERPVTKLNQREKKKRGYCCIYSTEFHLANQFLGGKK